MSKETKAVAVVDSNPDLSLQAKEVFDWLKAVEKEAKKLLNDDPKEALKKLLAVETLQMTANKVRMDEIQRRAAKTQITMQRNIGAWLIKVGKKQGQSKENEDAVGLKELGLEKIESSRFKQLAQMPTFVFKRALEVANIASTNQVLKEASRYKLLKVVVDDHDEADADVLKRFVEEGYSATQAQQELSSASDDDDSDDMMDDDDDDIIMTADFTESMKSFAENAEAMENLVSEVVEDLAEVDEIDPDDYKIGITALKSIVASVKTLKDAFREAKEKVSD